jgi:hypothetical protein
MVEGQALLCLFVCPCLKKQKQKKSYIKDEKNQSPYFLDVNTSREHRGCFILAQILAICCTVHLFSALFIIISIYKIGKYHQPNEEAIVYKEPGCTEGNGVF